VKSMPELTHDEHIEAQRLHGELARIKAEKDGSEEELNNIMSWLNDKPIMAEHDLIRMASSELNISFTDAKKALTVFPKEYSIQGQYIPDIIKQMRQHRRGLKGEHRTEIIKAIENLIFAYSDHLDSCIKSIYWVSDYAYPLKNMRYSESDLRKLHSVKEEKERREIIDCLCKFWEADLNRKTTPYNEEYSKLSKKMTKAKKAFRSCLSGITHQSIRKNWTEQGDEFILTKVCEYPGISARELHEQMPQKLYKRSSSQIISKSANRLGVTQISGKYYKLPNDIKKDLYAYTAAFIDSDGYITMDKNHNPRVGLVATGDRGKAFMMEIHKELGVGKLHLDQKSPQNTRPVNRLNFYSQGDITELLNKCRPHFRMKGKNADLLLELIRMKKSYKKADWYKNRCVEIFKLMKYENHKDHVNYDFTQYDVDIETVAKLHDNCKMDAMDSLESIGVMA
tara:strand:- start:1468 stop:2826 length:1359 start_codon:yes stop_codon:yes gene_type:complete